jgi:hypothetical protein
MKSLNGWQRIGVIVSVVWSVFAVLHALSSHDAASAAILHASINACTAENMHHCMELAYKEYAEMQAFDANLLGHAAVTAILPVVAGWVVCLAAVWLVRWVKVGFGKK